MVDFDEVRKEVAIKHGMLLDENDPMLITVTINEEILNQYVEMVASQNAEFVKAVNASIQKGIADSKLTAGRVISESGDYVSERLRATVVEVLKETEAKAAYKQAPEKEDGASNENYMYFFFGMGLMAVPLIFNIFVAKGWI
jgi:transcriptional activator TraM